MPRFPKPWFRKDRNRWYVQLDGKQHNLGADREAAFDRYHELMREPRKRRMASETVPAIIDLFLDWCEKNRAPRTYDWYQVPCQAFVDTIPPELRVTDLRPHHLQTRVDAHPGWDPGNKRNARRAIQRGHELGGQARLYRPRAHCRFREATAGKARADRHPGRI